MARAFESFGEYEKYDRMTREDQIVLAYESSERLKKHANRLEALLRGERAKEGFIKRFDFSKLKFWGGSGDKS